MIAGLKAEGPRVWFDLAIRKNCIAVVSGGSAAQPYGAGRASYTMRMRASRAFVRSTSRSAPSLG